VCHLCGQNPEDQKNYKKSDIPQYIDKLLLKKRNKKQQIEPEKKRQEELEDYESTIFLTWLYSASSRMAGMDSGRKGDDTDTENKKIQNRKNNLRSTLYAHNSCQQLLVRVHSECTLVVGVVLSSKTVVNRKGSQSISVQQGYNITDNMTEEEYICFKGHM